MGNYSTVNMVENFKRNQEFITEMNTIKIDRQLQIRKQMRDRETALEIAKQRELFFWFGAFYLTSVAWTLARKRYNTYSPLIPLTFIMAYQTDLAYGNKLHRIRVEAEHIIQFEQDLLTLPSGLPTAASIDLGRMDEEEEKKLHPKVPHL